MTYKKIKILITLFYFRRNRNICYLSEKNIGMTGALLSSDDDDYFEMIDYRTDCSNMFVCQNKKCIHHIQVCNGKNDCLDRSDENVCTVKNLDYELRLSGTNLSYEGRLEVKSK